MIKSFKKYKIENTNKIKSGNFENDGREHYVYRVTDLSRVKEKYYYGSHTPPKTKKYNSLVEEFWSYGTSSKRNNVTESSNFKLKILKVFNNSGEKILYESFLHQYFNVKNNNMFWNASNQKPNGFNTTNQKGTFVVLKDNQRINTKHKIEGSVSINKGMVSVLNNSGDTLYVHKNSQEAKEYKSVTYNKVNVIDKNGISKQIDKNSTEYKEKEWVGVHKNKISCYINGTKKVKLINKEDFNPKIHKFVLEGYISVEDSEGNKFSIIKDSKEYSKFLSVEYKSIHKNKVNVFDNNGNIIKIDKQNPKFLSGEYKTINKGKSLVYDFTLEKYRKINKDAASNNKLRYKNPNSHIFVKNKKTNTNEKIKVCFYVKNINNYEII